MNSWFNEWIFSWNITFKMYWTWSVNDRSFKSIFNLLDFYLEIQSLFEWMNIPSNYWIWGCLTEFSTKISVLNLLKFKPIWLDIWWNNLGNNWIFIWNFSFQMYWNSILFGWICFQITEFAFENSVLISMNFNLIWMNILSNYRIFIWNFRLQFTEFLACLTRYSIKLLNFYLKFLSSNILNFDPAWLIILSNDWNFSL